MYSFIEGLVHTFIPIFVAVDFFGIVPIFLAITDGFETHRRTKLQRESLLTALLVGLVFMVSGRSLFNFLGITEHDFKLAGGLLLLVFAVSDLLGSQERTKNLEGTGVVPLGVPLIVGPAVLTTILVLVDQYGIWPTLVSFVLNLLMVWVGFNWAEKIFQFLGKAGIKVLSKIMCLLLASIAIMMIRVGVTGIIMEM